MVKIMFVCLGNICRSPMAECVMSKMIKDNNLQDCVSVASSATSFEVYREQRFAFGKVKVEFQS